MVALGVSGSIKTTSRTYATGGKENSYYQRDKLATYLGYPSWSALLDANKAFTSYQARGLDCSFERVHRDDMSSVWIWIFPVQL